METNNSDPLNFRYFKGYPDRCLRMRWADFGCATLLLTPFLAASIFGLFLTVYYFNDVPKLGAGVRLIGLATFTSVFGYWLWDAVYLPRYLRHFRIVPYFQERLGDIHTIYQGHNIAKDCRALDELSQQLGVTPLSAFGFNDDFHSEEFTWHPAEKGLAAMTVLIDSLQASDLPNLSDKDRVVKELVSIQNALRIASQRNVMFCFIINPPPFGPKADVWQTSKGSCF